MSQKYGRRSRYFPILGRKASPWVAWPLVVIAILGLMGLVVLPGGLFWNCDCWKRQSQVSACLTMRTLVTAQAEAVYGLRIDRDGDGIGEYCTLAELNGVAVPDSGVSSSPPPLLPSSFRAIGQGVHLHNGYHFAIFLPAGAGDRPSPDACERYWCAYAWPREASSWVSRAFFVNQEGTVLSCPVQGEDGGVYAGAAGPARDAAFLPGSAPGSITGKIARDARGTDGRDWSVVH